VTLRKIFNPLLNLASEILESQQERIGVQALQGYVEFLKNRESYWHSESALEFVKTNSTHYPAKEFAKNLLPY